MCLNLSGAAGDFVQVETFCRRRDVLGKLKNDAYLETQFRQTEFFL